MVTTPPIGADMASTSRNTVSALTAISSLRPILELMNISFDGTEWHYKIDRNLKWDIILAHTAGVGEIIIDNTEATPPAAYMYISRSLAGACLFPNLARLRLINEPLHSSLSHLPLFFSPRLHSLEIDNISQDDIPGLECFLGDPDLQASLTNVILGPIECSSRILGAILQCRSVEIVTLTFLSSKPLGNEVIWCLGAMPKLQSLTIKADHVPYTLSDEYNGCSAAFAALKDICIIGVYSFIETMLTAILQSCATYHTLDLTISSDWATESPSPFSPLTDYRNGYSRGPIFGATLPSRIETLLSGVVRKWSHSLRGFILAVDSGTQGTISPHPTLRREFVGHLAKLQGLHQLVMRGFHLTGLGDVIESGATKPGQLLWPNIKDVQFPMLLPDPKTGVQTPIYLSTFYYLVRHCKNLVSFGGLITLSSADYLSKEFDKNPIPSGLKLLSTGSLEATEWSHDMIRVARLLEKLCPDLDKIITHSEFSPTIWSHISGTITALKEARQEGRAALASLSAN